MGIMLSLRLFMIDSDPAITKDTIRMPNASASTLFVLSGAVLMCRKKTRVNAHLCDGEDGKPQGTVLEDSDVFATQKDVAVRRMARNNPARVDEHFWYEARPCVSPGARSYRVSVEHDFHHRTRMRIVRPR